MLQLRWRRGLQFFAEGGDGAGDAGAGVTADDAGQSDGLAELGIPEEKAERYRKAKARMGEQIPVKAKTEENAAQPDQPSATDGKGTAEISWEDFMAKPENAERLNEMFRKRLKEDKGAADRLSEMQEALAPAMEILARKYGIDATDLDGLSKAIVEDDDLYAARAAELGTDAATARKLDEYDRLKRERSEQAARRQEEEQIRAHIHRMQEQAEELKKEFPQFDLLRELENPTFKRWTSPQFGMSVKDAFYNIHRQEIDEARTRQIAEQMQKATAASVRAGQRRPEETAGSPAPASTGEKLYSAMTREERAAFKQRLIAESGRR